MNMVGTSCLVTQKGVDEYGQLLLSILRRQLGVEDLTAESCVKLADNAVIERLRPLARYVSVWTNVDDSPWLPACREAATKRVGLVFGSNFWEPVAEHALELYRNGTLTHFIVSGHQSKRLPQPEGVIIANHLMRGGVPPEAIVTEVHARNTSENARNSLQQYGEHFAPWGIPEVIVVAKRYHARRCLTALREHMVRLEEPLLPSRVGLAGVSLGPEHHPETWVEHQVGREHVVGEVFRIARYHGLIGRHVPCAEAGRITEHLADLRKIIL